MSYGPPPKTAYGDQDFIKEDIAPQTPSFAQPPSIPSQQQQQFTGANYQTPKANPYSQPSPYGQLPVGQQAIGAGYPPPPPLPPPDLAADPNANPLLTASQTMTQEDILFMKSWRQDIFYRRVLPLVTIANGGLFYYNRIKSLPHKPLRHILLTGVCYFIGVWSSRGELRRRIMESPLNTPFMQAMRRLTGLQGGQASEFQDATMMFQDPSAGWSTTSDGFSRRPYPPPQAPSPYSSPSSSPAAPMSPPYNQPNTGEYYSGSYDIGLNNNPDLPRDNHRLETGDSAVKQVTSYEELRARNRGLLPPR